MDRKAPLVSVVVRTHNRAGYLKNALQCLKDQTWPNLEIFVVDHDSSDNTAEIVKSYGDSIRYYQHKGNFRDTFNVWRDKIKGEFVSFLDDDDYITPDCIEKLMNILIANNDIHIVFPRQKWFEEKKDRCIIMGETEKIDNTDIRKILIQRNVIQWNGVVLRSDCLQNIPLIDAKISGAFDWYFWILLDLAGYKFFQVNHFLGYIRRSQDSVQYEIPRMGKGVLECIEHYGRNLSLYEKLLYGYYHSYGYRLICNGVICLEHGDIAKGRHQILQGLYNYLFGGKKILKLFPAMMIYVISFISDPQKARSRIENTFKVFLFRNYYQMRVSNRKLRTSLLYQSK